MVVWCGCFRFVCNKAVLKEMSCLNRGGYQKRGFNFGCLVWLL
ncbi:hypothetical protein HPHPH45_1603 [Helicobacter pylori Hp H-45]|uniref:Uncharacterized protein n=1 Tax=Helicobacter pylori Hp H-45 TaxID=992050 RepID=I9T6T2_HELPX|nr:hypothetical protein HPHPH45_1603 [Helicobacter pylori Hp H-45]